MTVYLPIEPVRDADHIARMAGPKTVQPRTSRLS